MDESTYPYPYPYPYSTTNAMPDSDPYPNPPPHLHSPYQNKAAHAPSPYFDRYPNHHPQEIPLPTSPPQHDLSKAHTKNAPLLAHASSDSVFNTIPVICPTGFAISNAATTPVKYIKVGGNNAQKPIPALTPPPSLKYKKLKRKKY